MPVGINGITYDPYRTGKGKLSYDLENDYVTLDIETTGLDPKYDKIIEIAVVKYKNDIQVDGFSTLINPEREIDDFITELTGITNEMVLNAPFINEVIPDLNDLIGKDILLGHNIVFDVNFIYDYNFNYYSYLNDFEKASISNNYIDTMYLSRKLFKGMANYKLRTLVNFLGVAENTEHRALSDCLYTSECYRIMKKYISENNIDLKSKPKHWKAKDIVVTTDVIDKDNLLFEKECVFTGELERMTRKHAMQMVIDIGGKCADNVTRNTNFLILGNFAYQDYKSNKRKKAEEYKRKGYEIEIISENVFYDILNFKEE